MIKGISKNIVCDYCHSIITNVLHLSIIGKSGKLLHYCHTENKNCYKKQREGQQKQRH